MFRASNNSRVVDGELAVLEQVHQEGELLACTGQARGVLQGSMQAGARQDWAGRLLVEVE